MYKQSSERLIGNNAFEGFAIDLIAEIAQILSKKNFNNVIPSQPWLSDYSVQ
jgi:hypothetical protein